MRRLSPSTLHFLRAAIEAEPRKPCTTSHPLLLRPRVVTGTTSPWFSARRYESSASSNSARASDTNTESKTKTKPHHHDSAPLKTSDETPEPTFYDLFPATLPQGPPPHGPFALDERALRAEYLQLQAGAHPDRHAATHGKVASHASSARINDAYRTLRDPLLRAQYLLRLRGVDVAGDERATVEEDPGLLMEVMEVREAIEELGFGAEEEVEGLRRENEGRIGECVARLAEAFGRDDVQAARREAVRLRYWRNVQQCLDEWEPGRPVVLQH